MTTTTPLLIAIVVNISPTSPYEAGIKSSFVDAFDILVPTAQIDFYDPVIKAELPDPQKYDLIILSGGENVLSGEPWIESVIDFVKTVVREQEHGGKMKLLGICWGHQAIAIATGGTVRNIVEGPVGGLETMPLTPAGKLFLPTLASKGAFTATQLHVREVVFPAPGFIPLAENGEAFIAESDMILSFQAHPEIMGMFASFVMRNSDSYSKGLTPEEKEKKVVALGGEQDGMVILQRALQWVAE